MIDLTDETDECFGQELEEQELEEQTHQQQELEEQEFQAQELHKQAFENEQVQQGDKSKQEHRGQGAHRSSELLRQDDLHQKRLDRIEMLISELQHEKQALEQKRTLIANALVRMRFEVDTKAWEASGFAWSAKIESLRKQVFAVDKWRRHQKETINCTLSKRDCFLVMRSGGGKSLCFQLPALIDSGITLVVSPLVALMEDQVMEMNDRQPGSATNLDSSISQAQQTQVYHAMADASSDLRIVYVTPEKVAKSKRLQSALDKAASCSRLSRFVIDEAHCCSEWGHDFRKDFAELRLLKHRWPQVPMLAVTATATVRVAEDVKKLLGLGKSFGAQCEEFRSTFNRPEIMYSVLPKHAKDVDAVDELAGWIESRHAGKSGIVYCLSQKETETVAAGLHAKGITAACYHAGCSPEHKSQVHHRWKGGSNNSGSAWGSKLRVVVATVAFGLGINKLDVRFVAHFSLSKSIEGYYQESGRAGRDMRPAEAVIFYKVADVMRVWAMECDNKAGRSNVIGMVRYCEGLMEEGRKETKTEAGRVEGCRRHALGVHFGELAIAMRSSSSSSSSSANGSTNGSSTSASTAGLASKSSRCCDLCILHQDRNSSSSGGGGGSGGEDVCQLSLERLPIEEQDLTHCARSVLLLLRTLTSTTKANESNAAAKGGAGGATNGGPVNVTLKKLAETFRTKGSGGDGTNGSGSGKSKAGDSGKANGLDKEECERLLLHMVLQGLLQERWHYTVYSNICYIEEGPYARQLLGGSGIEVYMKLRQQQKAKGGSKKQVNPKKEQKAHDKKKTGKRRREVEHSDDSDFDQS
jgi:ATP-dependent DNA helicase Q1